MSKGYKKQLRRDTLPKELVHACAHMCVRVCVQTYQTLLVRILNRHTSVQKYSFSGNSEITPSLLILLNDFHKELQR